jgi:hypothetical protein
MEPDIITKCRLNGETVYTKEATYNPLKSASVVPKEEISSWARLHQIQEQESKNIKSAAVDTQEHQISSWARLHRLGSAN